VTQVRLAGPDDFEAVTALLEELGRPHVDDRPVSEAIYLQQFEDPLAAHLVAEQDGEIVGVCTLHFRTRLNQKTLEAWVPDLIVRESLRGQGVGKALLGEAERLSRERGCHWLTLESANFRKEAHAFYAAFGMDQPGLTFLKPLV